LLSQFESSMTTIFNPSSCRVPTNGLSFQAQLYSSNSMRTDRSSSSKRASLKLPSSPTIARARVSAFTPSMRPLAR
jgi:hypothetical protein